ncbi:MurR/RpiR family transcriptional regulator [Paenibacillus solisilvae]|uniref:MurR/RpiR family transcriptional regulator n=1 Tax=Paenibacillus solisilvae TaxID=2486751 RepID=A0ABW0W4T4_9BACL
MDNAQKGYVSGSYSGDALQMIQNIYSQLRKSEKSVADYIVQNPEKTIKSNIAEIAIGSGVSEATVIRFCKAAGFSGFQDLKMTLARHSSSFGTQAIYENIRKEDSLEIAIQKMYANNIQALNGTVQSLDLEQLESAAKAISRTRMIYLFGVGTSGTVAEYAEYRFTRIGLMTRAYTDSQSIAMATALVRPGDVVITISQSGSTKEIVEASEIVKKNGALTVTVTGHPRSPLAKTSKVILRSAVNEAPYESGGMPSLMTQLSVIDALMVAASLENFDASIAMILSTAEAVKSKKY